METVKARIILLADERSDHSSSDVDDDEYDLDTEVTLHSIRTSKTINFSIRSNYTEWTARDAFRELVQNWYVILRRYLGHFSFT